MLPNNIQGAQLLGCFEIQCTGGSGGKERKFWINFHDALEFDYPIYNEKERVGTEVSNSSGENRK